MPQSQKKILLSIVALVALFFIFTQYKKKSNRANQVAVTHSQTKFYEVAQQPLPSKAKPVASNSTASDTTNIPESPLRDPRVPAWCQSQWDRLYSQGAKYFYEELATGQQNQSADCLSYLPNAQGMKEMVQNFCSKQKDEKTFKNLCPGTLIMYRAFLIALETSNEKDFSKLPLRVLINKVVGEIIQGDTNYKAKGNELRQMAKAIQDTEPNNPSTYKMMGTVELLFDNNEGVRKSAEEGLRLNPDDRTLKDMYFAAKAKESNSDFESYWKTHTNDDLATYHWASQLWKNGKTDQARQLVTQLVQKFPQDERYKRTLEKMQQTSDPKASVFEITVTFLTEDW